MGSGRARDVRAATAGGGTRRHTPHTLKGRRLASHNHRGSVDERSREPGPARRRGHRRCGRCRLADRRARPVGPGHRGRDGPPGARRRRAHARPTSTASATPPRSMAFAEYLGIHPGLHRLHHDRRLELRDPRRARRAAIARRALRGRGRACYAPRPGGDRDRPGTGDVPRRRRADQIDAEWEAPYGMRMPMGPYALAASRHMADLRHHVASSSPRSPSSTRAVGRA